MSTMQAFYSRLFSPDERENSYLAGLAELTRATLEDIASLEFDGIWALWA